MFREFRCSGALRWIFGVHWCEEMGGAKIVKFNRLGTADKMGRRNKSTKGQVSRAETTICARFEKWQKMLEGDPDALWECMLDRGMCSKEDLNEYHKNKERVGY